MFCVAEQYFPLLLSILSPSSPFIVLIMEVIEVERIVCTCFRRVVICCYAEEICNTYLLHIFVSHLRADNITVINIFTIYSVIQ